MNMTNSIFMAVVFVLGIVLAVLSARMHKKLAKNCSDKKVLESLSGLSHIATILMVASASFFVCGMTCDCSKQEANLNMLVYSGFFLVLGLVLTTLGGVIHSNASGNCAKAKQDAPGVIAIGVIMMVGGLGYLGYEGYNRYNRRSVPQFSF
jgi:uncharacterized membrane protein YidH (DUF202 family)